MGKDNKNSNIVNDLYLPITFLFILSVVFIYFLVILPKEANKDKEIKTPKVEDSIEVKTTDLILEENGNEHYFTGIADSVIQITTFYKYDGVERTVVSFE